MSSIQGTGLSHFNQMGTLLDFPEKLNLMEKNHVKEFSKEITAQELLLLPRLPLNETGRSNYALLFYYKLAEATHERMSQVAFLSPATEVTERFTNIHCVKSSAIEVKGFPKPFLHANRVRFEISDFPDEIQTYWECPKSAEKILTQCPIGPNEKIISLDGPVSETQEMFWKAVLENSNLILDLTQTSDAVDRYYPGSTQETRKRTFGNITVTCRKKKMLEHGIKALQYRVEDKASGKERDIVRIHYPSWKDYGGIDSSDLEKILYLKAVEDHIAGQYKQQRPAIVHCRAGVGRSGTYMVACSLIELQRNHLLNSKNLIETIYNLTLKGREQRGHGFVQAAEQIQTLIELGEKIIDAPHLLPKIEFDLHHSKAKELPISGTTLERAKRLSEKNLRERDWKKLNQLLKTIELLDKENRLSASKKAKFVRYIETIKCTAVNANAWKAGYIDIAEIAQTEPALPEKLQQKINFTLNTLNSGVPREVKSHPAYHTDYQILGRENRSFEAEDQVKSLLKRLEGKEKKAVYLFRESSTRRGADGEHFFTITFGYYPKMKKKMELLHCRLFYDEKRKRWGAEKSEKTFKSLEALRSFVIQKASGIDPKDQVASLPVG